MNVQYLVDEKTGKKTGVVHRIEEYKELLEKDEDTEALKMLNNLRKEKIITRSFDDFLADYSENV